jgi:hypothetical protein
LKKESVWPNDLLSFDETFEAIMFWLDDYNNEHHTTHSGTALRAKRARPC